VPPGIRLVRVNATTGRLAEPGDKPIIFEAFKPGSDLNGDQPPVVLGDTSLQWGGGPDAPLGPAEGSDAGGVSTLTTGSPPVGSTITPLPMPRLGPPPLKRTTPGAGTGGLY
jgi:penicillin-binding protein 1A